MRYKLIISYDGSKFYGFQRQSKLVSVQKTIEDAISSTFNEDVTIHGSGRTDVGVHALGQVIDFKLKKEIPLYNLKKVLNKKLNPYIYISDASVVSDDFHSRINAVKKEYHYIISTNEFNPTKADYIYYVDSKININSIKETMKLFIGTRDFRSVSKNTPDKDTIKTIYSFELEEKNGEYIFKIVGDAFLRNMIRVIIAILVRVGLGKLSIDDVKSILNSNSRLSAPWVAPASGLYLYKVFYEDTTK